MTVFDDVKSILNEDIFFKIQSTRILVVGAGGIGCELVKDLILCGFCNITIVDMDGIDVSNLNRQFFFRKRHVGMYKSEVVASEARRLLNKCYENNRPASKITGIVGNILDFNTEFFVQFEVVLNALDNVLARTHVNKMCLASNIELIDSGSAGYNGQVHPIIPRITRCYECFPPPTQKTYPVCTIRSIPDKPQHSIAWSKYLFELIFGVRQKENEDSENILSDISTKVQINLDRLRKLEKKEFNSFIEKYIIEIFDFLFNHEISNLLKNKEMYLNNNRQIPIPIAWRDVLEKKYKNQMTAQKGNLDDSEKITSTLEENAQLFFNSIKNIFTYRLNEIGTPSFSFDKDDKESMDFVSAASNLRSYNFHIPLKSRWECQSIAGSIIPAIASTNAIVSGVQVIQLLLLIKSKISNLEHSINLGCGNSTRREVDSNKFVWIRSTPMGRFLICPENLEKPNPNCLICSQTLLNIKLSNLDNWTLAEFVQEIICKNFRLSEPSIEFNGKCIWDPDLLQEEKFNISSKKSLLYWKFTDGCLISITDFSNSPFQCDAIISVCSQDTIHSDGNRQVNEKNGEIFTIKIESHGEICEDYSNNSNETENSKEKVFFESYAARPTGIKRKEQNSSQQENEDVKKRRESKGNQHV
ncbi:SUMO-activating enzyme subunit 2 [Cryptosporidium felis]|nr:SUMO-activating enzyme subunit 2 [Cryptosporidium felis]